MQLWPVAMVIALISAVTVLIHLPLPINPAIVGVLIPPIALLAIGTGQNPALYALPVGFTVVRDAAAARCRGGDHLLEGLLSDDGHAFAWRDHQRGLGDRHDRADGVGGAAPGSPVRRYADAIPCLFMRGGTSRGPFFLESDLPSDIEPRPCCSPRSALRTAGGSTGLAAPTR